MPHSTYLPHRMGSATVDPTGCFEAGSFQSFTLTYTAGYFGIDDTGSIKIVHRFASDMGKPQFDDPAAPNYVTAEASNGAVLDMRYDGKMNIRPWDKTLYIKVVRGFLREGDRIVVRFGDPRQGSPGMRLQTFCEATFEFRVLVDAIATYNYVELPVQPEIAIVPGPPSRWKAILPTERAVGERFRLCLKGEDAWGNPSDRCDYAGSACARMSGVDGLPETVRFAPGAFSVVVEDLSVSTPGDLRIEMLGPDGAVLARSNPLRISKSMALKPYWGDLHGQSEETIGTNCAREFFAFARDKAFLDVCSHQGNDFQITTAFWNYLNELTAEFNADGRFIVFPGYEWSGNTGLGGDRNVLFLEEGRPIHRSSHALVDDLSDIETDANSAENLFEALRDEDCVVFAHIGGRYADIEMSHDARLERAVEVHSAWGTFEWLVRDAFEQGYRVGICSNSDGHKGRPGASYPGATTFGAYGGLTCLLANGPRAPGNRGLPAGASLLRHHRLPDAPRHPRAFRHRCGAVRGRSEPRPVRERGGARGNDGRRGPLSGRRGSRLRHRSSGVRADRADRDPERAEDPRSVPSVQRRGPRPPHPRQLGGIGVSRSRTADDLGRLRLPGRQRLRAARADQPLQPRQAFRADRSGRRRVDRADHGGLRRVRCVARGRRRRRSHHRYCAGQGRNPDCRNRAR